MTDPEQPTSLAATLRATNRVLDGVPWQAKGWTNSWSLPLVLGRVRRSIERRTTA